MSETPMDMTAPLSETEFPVFRRYFTLEEAAAMLPRVRRDLSGFQRELSGLKDDIVLFKRILMSQKRQGSDPSEAELDVLHGKYARFEDAYNRGVRHFEELGILVRDMEHGLMDFPYRSESRGEDLFLCWKGDEDGIFYFHECDRGFSGRMPITVLPE
ncbi:MAG: DUF2203 domain-containing protein [Candidatus Melainabacteria bacterium]